MLALPPLVKAVDGVDLTLYGGEVLCMLGHNGAGKSTAIGLTRPLDSWV